MDLYPFDPAQLALIAAALAAVPTLMYVRIASSARGAWSRDGAVATHGVGAYRAMEVRAPASETRPPLSVRAAAFAALCVGQMALPLAALAAAWALGPTVVGDLGVFVPGACGGRLAIAHFAPLIWVATGAGALAAALCIASAAALLRRAPRARSLARATAAAATVATAAVAAAYVLAARATDARDVVYNGCVLRGGGADAWVGPLALPYTSMTPWSALAVFAAGALLAALACLPLTAGFRRRETTAG